MARGAWISKSLIPFTTSAFSIVQIVARTPCEISEFISYDHQFISPPHPSIQTDTVYKSVNVVYGELEYVVEVDPPVTTSFVRLIANFCTSHDVQVRLVQREEKLLVFAELQAFTPPFVYGLPSAFEPFAERPVRPQCVLADWGAWSSCIAHTNGCGDGVQERTRTGTNCVDYDVRPLIEYQPCDATPCAIGPCILASLCPYRNRLRVERVARVDSLYRDLRIWRSVTYHRFLAASFSHVQVCVPRMSLPNMVVCHVQVVPWNQSPARLLAVLARVQAPRPSHHSLQPPRRPPAAPPLSLCRAVALRAC